MNHLAQRILPCGTYLILKMQRPINMLGRIPCDASRVWHASCVSLPGNAWPIPKALCLLALSFVQEGCLMFPSTRVVEIIIRVALFTRVRATTNALLGIWTSSVSNPSRLVMLNKPTVRARSEPPTSVMWNSQGRAKLAGHIWRQRLCEQPDLTGAVQDWTDISQLPGEVCPVRRSNCLTQGRSTFQFTQCGQGPNLKHDYCKEHAWGKAFCY